MRANLWCDTCLLWFVGLLAIILAPCKIQKDKRLIQAMLSHTDIFTEACCIGISKKVFQSDQRINLGGLISIILENDNIC